MDSQRFGVPQTADQHIRATAKPLRSRGRNLVYNGLALEKPGRISQGTSECPARSRNLQMLFEPLKIAGAFLIGVEPISDERGWFARGFCQREFSTHGIDFQVAQANRSFNAHAGTLRGFHGQYPPHGEQKLLRCVQGSLVDVLVDLRPESPTFLQWQMVELSAANQLSLLIPQRCCHALQTQSDTTEILYLVSAFYAPDAEFGLRWDDPQLGIQWPKPVSEISAKDARWPLLSESLATIRRRMAPGEGQPA